MAASPSTSVFLVSRVIILDPTLSLALLSTTFLTYGLGSFVQTCGFGARLPFMVMPGGVPNVISPTITCQAGAQRTVGAVLLDGIALSKLAGLRAVPAHLAAGRTRDHAAARRCILAKNLASSSMVRFGVIPRC